MGTGGSDKQTKERPQTAALWFYISEKIGDVTAGPPGGYGKEVPA